jgi:Mce-associated membrane protein
MAGTADGTGVVMTPVTVDTPVEEVQAAGEEGPAPRGKDSPSTGGRRLTVVLVAGAVAVLLLVAAAAAAVAVWVGDQTRDGRRDDAAAAARNLAVALTSINHDTADADVQRVIDASTGDFRNLFTQNLGSYTDVVRQGEVVSTGEVLDAGVQRLEGDEAYVIVAVRSDVKNKQVPDGESRNYRMMIEMQQQDAGDWLATRVDFVP